jgi:hypothetical protein
MHVLEQIAVRRFFTQGAAKKWEWNEYDDTAIATAQSIGG